MNRALSCRIVLAVVASAAAIAHAGGPLGICSTGGPQVAVTYPSPFTVSLRYDGGGNLGVHTPAEGGGVRTKAQADAIVTAAAALWTNVSTANITLTRGTDLPGDMIVTNYGNFYSVPANAPSTTFPGGTSHFAVGNNPVIYDDDGSITDDLLGAGASTSGILGFAGSVWDGSCHYVSGQAVINGAATVSDNTMKTVLAHELGHLIGLDHSEINGTQGLSTANYPLMYPIAYRSSVSLGDDDISAVTSLYPDTTAAASYGTLQGNFLTAGSTPVPGANIWAKENTTGKVYSVVSDYLANGDGFFKMLLPPGTYTLHATALAVHDPGSPSFTLTMGSGAGPYAVDLTDLSFQPPLYTAPNGGGSPMTPVVLGGGSPNQIVITAGCVATTDFHINGTGSVSGNCVAGPPPPPVPGHIVAISTRMPVLTGDSVPIAGFIVGGSAAKTVAVRAKGPSLASQGVINPLADPMLNLVPAAGGGFANNDWATDPNAGLLSSDGFAPTVSTESAILMSAAPGAYTAIETGFNGLTGVGLVEVYEVDHPEIPITGISTRGFVGTADNVMIGGFIIQGDTPVTVLVRARGPSLAAQGVAGVLANPTLQLISGPTVLATNDDWASAPNAAAISASGQAPTDPHESAILMTLNPGAYTAVVSGVGNTTGVGIVEIFQQ